MTTPIEIEAKLVAPNGDRAGKGEIEYGVSADGSTSLELTVSGLDVPLGVPVSVFRNGQHFCDLNLTGWVTRRGQLRLSSSRGDHVPAVVCGDQIDVCHAGDVLLSGVTHLD